MKDLPNLDNDCFQVPATDSVFRDQPSTHKPRILLLYGSLRQRSFSRLVVEEAARLLEAMGAEPKVFHADGLPLPDSEDASHPKVQELRDLVTWSEGMVWCSPERHGAMTGIMKAQIDWIPLALGGSAPHPGQNPGGDAGERRLAVVQHRQSPARAGPLDAHAHHPQPVIGAESVSGIR